MGDDRRPEIEPELAVFDALVAAMGDPLRSKLLIAVGDSRERGLTIRQIAERTEEPQRRVRYHLDQLLKQGLIGIAAEQRRRGVVERYYRVEQKVMISGDDIGRVESSQLKRINFEILRAILTDASAALAADAFNRAGPAVVARTYGEVDRQGWMELMSTCEAVVGRVQEIIASSEERMCGKAAESIPVVSGCLLFQARETIS